MDSFPWTEVTSGAILVAQAIMVWLSKKLLSR